MKKLKPTSAHVTFIYTCPKCGCDIWVPQEEAVVPDFKVVCCNSSFTLDAIKSTNIKYRTLSSQQSEFKPKSERVLRGMGFTLAEARQLIAKAMDKHRITSAEELTKYALAEV
jgi:hypothetical protein